MKILITIGHPAHVHYFKNITKVMQSKGNIILFFVRDRECIIDLVKKEGFDYVCYGKGGNDMFSKMIHIPIIDYKLLKVALRFKPDYFLSFASPYAAHVSVILRKPHITLDDTEHAKLEHMLYRPFSDVIFSPYVYNAKLHKKQILIKSLIENFYLQDDVFNFNINVLSELNVRHDEPYCVVRFISWNANHDVGYKGLSYQDKIDIVTVLSEKYKVFISSEGELPKVLEKYRLLSHPSEFHSVMAYATVCISEGSTTASESAVLGTPTIYVNPLKVSYCDEEEKYHLLFQLNDTQVIINKAEEILETKNIKNIYLNNKKLFVSNMIDANAFLVWFVENYPESKKIMMENPDYQYRFK